MMTLGFSGSIIHSNLSSTSSVVRDNVLLTGGTAKKRASRGLAKPVRFLEFIFSSKRKVILNNSAKLCAPTHFIGSAQYRTYRCIITRTLLQIKKISVTSHLHHPSSFLKGKQHKQPTPTNSKEEYLLYRM